MKCCMCDIKINNTDTYLHHSDLVFYCNDCLQVKLDEYHKLKIYLDGALEKLWE